ncbi:aldo/keto reductase, partial [Mycobacterium sp.]
MTGESGAYVPSIGLNDENTIPIIGLGVAELSDDETERAVSAALEIGYRLIDTAAVYGNEAAVGRAIAASGIPRAGLFVTSKLANADQGITSSQEAGKASLERLGLDYLDLYLIHWPAAQLGKYVDSFGGLIQLRASGLVRSIGVCNFTEEHLDTVIDLTFVTPAVNQIELHPLLNQAELRAVNARHNVVTEAYSPLAVGRLVDNPTVTSIAGEY